MVFPGSRGPLPGLEYRAVHPSPRTTWETALEFAAMSLLNCLLKHALNLLRLTLQVLRALGSPRFRSWTADASRDCPMIVAPDIPAAPRQLLQAHIVRWRDDSEALQAPCGQRLWTDHLDSCALWGAKTAPEPGHHPGRARGRTLLADAIEQNRHQRLRARGIAAAWHRDGLVVRGLCWSQFLSFARPLCGLRAYASECQV